MPVETRLETVCRIRRKANPNTKKIVSAKKEPTSPNRDTIPDSKYKPRPYRNIA